jgi:hypothetical protein
MSVAGFSPGAYSRHVARIMPGMTVVPTECRQRAGRGIGRVGPRLRAVFRRLLDHSAIAGRGKWNAPLAAWRFPLFFGPFSRFAPGLKSK